jgi:hypothetical protein
MAIEEASISVVDGLVSWLIPQSAGTLTIFLLNTRDRIGSLVQIDGKPTDRRTA